MLAAAALVNVSELTDVELDAPVARTSDSADPAQPTLMLVVEGKPQPLQRNHASHEQTWQRVHALPSGHNHLRRRHRPKADRIWLEWQPSGWWGVLTASN